LTQRDDRHVQFISINASVMISVQDLHDSGQWQGRAWGTAIRCIRAKRLPRIRGPIPIAIPRRVAGALIINAVTIGGPVLLAFSP
jgi:hypothetical protein